MEFNPFTGKEGAQLNTLYHLTFLVMDIEVYKAHNPKVVGSSPAPATSETGSYVRS